MRYQKIHVKIWDDEKFIELSEKAKFLFLYLLTSPHSNAIGAYVIKPGYIAEDINWPHQKAIETLSELSKKDLIRHDKKVWLVYIPKFFKYNPIENPNQFINAEKLLNSLPKSFILQKLIEDLMVYAERFNKPFRNPLETLSKPETETETETETEENTSAHRKTDAPPKYIFSSQFFDIDQAYFERLQADYPGLNPPILMAEIKKAADWCEDNPKKFKRKSNGKRANVKTFLRNWLDKVEVRPDYQQDGVDEWLKQTSANG